MTARIEFGCHFHNRHGRARPGHTRFHVSQGVDPRAKPGDDWERHSVCKKIILGIFTSLSTRAIIPSPRPKLRGATGAADRAGRGAVAMSEGVTHPQASRPKPGVPGPQSRGPLGSSMCVPNWLTRADLPAAEDSKCHSSGGRSEQAYKHRVRGAGERRIDWLTEACTILFTHGAGGHRGDPPRRPVSPLWARSDVPARTPARTGCGAFCRGEMRDGMEMRERNLPMPSWPGLFRPSTVTPAERRGYPGQARA